VQLIDIGVNLAHDSFDHDRAEVMDRARAAGVTGMVITGSCKASSHKARDLAREHPDFLAATAGVHPHHARDFTDADAGWIRDLAGDPQVKAVGECGLDFFRNFSPPEDQERSFHAQLELAAMLQLPVFLHQRDAHDRFCAILREHVARIPRGVAHCFTGDRKELEDYLALGLSIGITGWICDERRGAHLKALISEIPPERLMLETDAPYLLPRDLKPRPRTRRNEPCYLAHVLHVVADAAGRDPAAVAAQTRANAQRFFGLTDVRETCHRDAV
jgi:TatD DNase family protein